MKRWLVCLFTYNRPTFVMNAARSIDEFFPWGDRLLIDDGSSDPRAVDCVVEIGRRPNWQCKVMERLGRPYGGFYRNMRFALDYAVSNGYDYCFFFEDDEQFLWKKDDYPEYVDRLFNSCPDAIQVQPLFLRRILSYARNTEFIASVNAYRTQRGFSTTAIWNVATVRRHPDFQFVTEYGDGLPANSAWWLRHGYRLYLQADPTVAIIPWVNSHSESAGNVVTASSNEAGDQHNYVIPPLRPSAIKYLRHRNPTIVAYQEYFAHKDGLPIWHQAGQNMNRYFELCRRTIDEEDRLRQAPVRVSAIPEWRPTTLPPLQSHLSWTPAGTLCTRSMRAALGKCAQAVLPRRLIDWRHFSLKNYLGYRRLKTRLQAEIRALPFHRETSGC